ncbi:MAG: hypothetical protein R3F39_04145 [Myxococcota bacterium]
MQVPPHDSVRELSGMLVRVTVGTATFPGAIRERDGKRIRVSTDAPLRLRSTVRIALVDTDEQFGTVQFGARVTSVVAGLRGPEAWFEILRVVAAADVSFVARVVEPLLGYTPSSWLSFRREGPWTSYDLDPAASVTLPKIFAAPPAPLGDTHPEPPPPPPAYEAPRAIPGQLLTDCYACDLPAALTISGGLTSVRIHRASRDGNRVFCRVTGAPPRLGDAATVTLDAPSADAASAALSLSASVGWVDRPSQLVDAVEVALILSSRTPRETRDTWRRRLLAAAAGGNRE